MHRTSSDVRTLHKALAPTAVLVLLATRMVFAACGFAAAAPARCSARRARAPAAPSPRRRCAPLRAKQSLGDALLDVMEGGPKLRRWYGAAEKAPRDAGDNKPEAAPEEEEDEPGEGDAVLVSDADSPAGEAVVFALILASARVRLLCRDAAAAAMRFGEYAKPIQGDVADAAAVKRALRGTAAVVVTGALGGVPAAAAAAGAKHLVLLSAAPGALPGGLAALLRGAEDAARCGPQREQAARGAGVPLTVVRAGAFRDAPGGTDALALSAAGGLTGGLSREDAAAVCVAAALGTPPRLARVFEVCAGAGDVTLPPSGGNAAAWSDAIAALPQE